MKNLAYIFLLLISNSMFAQEQWEIEMIEEDSKYHFDSGSQLYNVAQNIIEFDYQLENLDTTAQKGKIEYEILSRQKNKVLTYALWEFNRVLEFYPTSSLINQSIFNKAQIHFELNQIDSARTYYHKLINKEIPSEKDTTVITNIDDDRFYNFKNSSYKRLAELEYQQGNYKESIQYLKLSQEVGYDHFCGNEHAYNSKYMAINFAKNYYMLDSLDKSINMLLPHIFNSGLTRNNDVVELAMKFLLEKYDNEFLIKELEKGFVNYTKRKPRVNSKNNKYFINFLSEELQLYMYERENLEEEKKVVRETIKSELIYKLLKE